MTAPSARGCAAGDSDGRPGKKIIEAANYFQIRNRGPGKVEIHSVFVVQCALKEYFQGAKQHHVCPAVCAC